MSAETDGYLARLGVATLTKVNWVSTEYPYGKNAIATYIFKYRSHSML